MRERSTLRIAFSGLLLVLSVLGMTNVFSDNTAVVIKARDLACGTAGCDARMAEMSRNPLWQTFRFEVGANHPKSVSVECHRDFYFAGAYQCAVH